VKGKPLPTADASPFKFIGTGVHDRLEQPFKFIGIRTPERKAVLDALREELRKRDYLPVLFDFDKPASRDITERLCS
jgi:hypothetical protein